MASISSLQISGSVYDIYAASAVSAAQATSATSAATADKATSATSAGSAAKLIAEKIITYAGHVTGTVTTDWGSNKTATMTVVAAPWSAMTNVSAGTVNTNTTGFVTPKAVYDYVQTQTAAAMSNVYTHKGTTGVSQLSLLTPKIGDVYNLTGCAETGTVINGQTAYNGDNFVATAAAAAATSWDKLAASFNASDYISKSTWNSSTGTWQSAYNAVSTNSASNWPNSAHKAFANVEAGTVTIAASTSASTVTLSGVNGLAVSGSGTTATVYPSAYAYGKINIGGAVTQATAMGDTFGFVAGTNMEITPNTTNKQATFSAKNTTYSQATSAALGINKASYVTGTTAVIF